MFNRFLYMMVIAILLGLSTNLAHADGCPSGTVQVGVNHTETENAFVNELVCKRIKPKPTKAAEDKFCKAKSMVAHDQQGLRSLNFQSDAEQFEVFEKISEDQKADFQHKAFDAALEQGLEIADKGVDAAKSLNPWDVNTAIKRLKSNNIVNEKLFSSMRSVAAAKGKPARAAAYRAFIKDMKIAHETADTVVDVSKAPQTKELRTLLGVLKIMQGNPELGLIVTTAEFGESFAYLYYLNGQVAEQDALTDQKLAQGAKLAQHLKAHVGTMKDAKKEWVEKGGQGGEPVCHP